MFHDSIDSGFDPALFETADQSNWSWFGDRGWQDATTRFWYRKFYADTQTGQLMILRTDNPRLYYYEGPSAGRIGNLQMVANLLSKIYLLLWILVILAALELIFRWR